MNGLTRLGVAGIVVVVIAAIAGFVVSSQATNSTTSRTGRALPISRQPEESASPGDEQENKWKSRLTAEQYLITRRKGTEPPFSGKYWNEKAKGIYKCVCCDTPLFDSRAKFDSGTGWPSFYKPIDDKNVDTGVDFSLFTQRTEVLCRNCHAHLGHVFEDAPQDKGGLRYCINSAALNFQEAASRHKTGGRPAPSIDSSAPIVREGEKNDGGAGAAKSS